MSVDLAATRPLGRTALSLPPFGFGAAPIGGLLGPVEEDAARGALEAAWEQGLRYFDTAPWYGLGLSEHRTGAFLRTKPRACAQVVRLPVSGRHCRMGIEPAHSITDTNDGVWGHDNLLIGDASLRLTNCVLNPVFTMMALAYRGADHILSSRGARVHPTTKSTA